MPSPPRGIDLLRNPERNRGTAFSHADREALGIEGLLPPVPDTLENQISRVKLQLSLVQDALQKYLLLLDLQSRNETLFFAVIMSDPETFIPLIYTPTVGEACQGFDHLFRATRGLYLPITARGRLHELLAHWPKADVRFIVVTDGERILGLGDLGIGGMGIPVGKLALYTACAGVPPRLTLPITLDVGTNNTALVEDPLYLGLRQPRVRGGAYHSFIDEFVTAAEDRYPDVCIQWEDFANFNAMPILSRYRDAICTFNDDIQGTAAIALAGILAALRISNQPLTEQRFLFLGGGSAATGIAGLVATAMTRAGLSQHEARGRQWLFDVDGLVCEGRQAAIADFQRPFAHKHAPVRSFVDAIETIRPTGIFGVSTVAKLFNQPVLEAMARINERPMIFPYSNPSSHSECTAEEAYRWTAGRAIFASGSAFSPVTIEGRTFRPGQGNNVYIFPAMGMAILATAATRVPQELFVRAAHAVADQVTDDDLAAGSIYPPLRNILDVSLRTAARVAEAIFDAGLARVLRPVDVEQQIRATQYRPVYGAT